METIHLTLSQDMQDFVHAETAKGQYGSTDEYIQSLIREERKRKEQAHLEKLLLDGLNSGPAQPMTDNDWDELKQHVLTIQAQNYNPK